MSYICSTRRRRFLLRCTLLRLLRGIVPFLVMTATFSTERVRVLPRELNAEPVGLSAGEAATIPSRHKTTPDTDGEKVLTAEAVCSTSAPVNRDLNTVARAQSLFDALDRGAGSSMDVRLLHSHFLAKTRDTAEEWLCHALERVGEAQRCQPRSWWRPKSQRSAWTSAVRRCTRSWLPAPSVLQRAGSCARYENEEGDVFVYRLPEDREGKPSYAPYLEGGQPAICDLTWEAVQ